jgi:hypothetical protein
VEDFFMALTLRNVVVAGVMGMGSVAVVAGPYGMAGCGLGSMVIDPSGSQTSAATTNGTAYNQLFGITSGTSNCKAPSEVAVITRQEDFVANNLSTLSKDMAKGSGESLNAFAETLGCDQMALNDVAGALKNSYSTIFAAPGAMAVLDTSKTILKANPTTSSRCQFLSL